MAAVSGALRGALGGVVAGAVWWAVEWGVNWTFGGVIPPEDAPMLLAIDCALGAAGGLLIGLGLGLAFGAARPVPLAMGLVLVYGFLRIYAPPGFAGEAAFLAAGLVSATLRTWLAGRARRGAVTFLQLTFAVTLVTVLGNALSGEAASTYFAHIEAKGMPLVLMLAGLPILGVLLDRVVGFVIRGGGLRLGVEVAAAAVAAVVWASPMSTTPIDDPIHTAPPPPPGTPDVILISQDTTRADHMSTYGYARETSPQLTKLAQDALNFTHAVSPAQWTVPGHASMLTGMFPSRHGAHYSGGWTQAEIGGRRRVFPLGEDKTTLAELLRDHGYHTGGFVANFGNLDRAFGFAQGFHRYEDLPGPLFRPIPHAVRFVQKFVPTFLKAPFRSAYEINEAALAWIDSLAPGRPFFLFLNYLEPHHWLAPPPFDRWAREVPGWQRLAGKGFFTHQIPVHLADDERRFIEAMYDGQILNMDVALGQLMDALRARGRYENAFIFVTADHGELLGEHQQVGHGGRMMYEGLLHIPLVVKFPGADRPRGEVTSPAQPVDILPTVMARLGGRIPDGVQGEPLPHVTHRIVSEEHVNPEFVATYGEVYDRAMRVLYEAPYKLITTSKGERLLFDLAQDPEETTNLAAREGERVAEMERRLDELMRTMTKVASLELALERGRWPRHAQLPVDFE